MRIIDIYNEDAKHQKLSSENLPLAVYLSAADNTTISIKPLSDESNTKDLIQGYISHEGEHLFFQPDDNNNNTLFHNNEIIENSVWLKSGDQIQINSKLVLYSVSGDKIKISISKKIERAITQVETAKKSNLEHNNNLKKNNPKLKSNTKKINKIVILLFFLLTLIAGFIIFAEMAEVNIKPSADSIELNGLFPAVQLDNRFILIAGHYDLMAKKEGYRELNKQLDIDKDNKLFSFTMKENPGKIQFLINPEENNKIILDTILLDKNTAFYEIDRGEHQLTIINPRYKEYKQTINVEGKNKQQNYTIELQPNWANISLQAKQEGTQLSIFSKNRKQKKIVSQLLTNNEQIELVAGHYIIEVTKEKFKPHRQNISVVAGDQLTLAVIDLEPEDGLLILNSKPENSLIRIDGQYQGKTPKSIKLSSNKEHEIELSLNGYNTIKKIISLQAVEELEENIKLRAKTGLIFITSTPEQAVLSINGIKQKRNSGGFNLTESRHRFTVQAKGYQTQSKTLNISNNSKNISFILTRNHYKKNKSNSVIVKQNKNYNNTIGLNMIRVKPAVFTMGSKRSEAGHRSNEHLHKVQLNYAYFLSDKEITNKQYRQFNPGHNSGSKSGQSLNSDKQPVVNISWQEAAKFANWLSIKDSLNPYYKELNGKLVPVDIKTRVNGYRLPYEAEWALAARGQQKQKYPWSGSYPPTLLSGNFSDSSASNHIANTLSSYNDKYSVSAPVASYPKNAMGFYDLGGNVSEWCQDYYSPSSIASGKKIIINPTGSAKGSHKIVRDSSWRDASISELRLSYRNYSKKNDNDIGFRLARYAP